MGSVSVRGSATFYMCVHYFKIVLTLFDLKNPNFLILGLHFYI